MITQRHTRALAAVVVVLSLLGLTACGGSSDTSTTGSNGSRYGSPSTEPTGDASAGKVVFTSSCGSCHTLADAGTSSDAGPNLDELALSDSTIADKVTNGVGGMPAFDNELSPQQIADVAAFVSSVAGG